MNRRLFLMLLGCLLGAMAAVAQPATEGTHGDRLEAADTARFHAAPFAMQSKVYRQTFAHPELEHNDTKTLVVGGNVQDEYCGNRAIRKATLFLRLAMGPNDYEFGYTDFSAEVEVRVTALNDQGNPLVFPLPMPVRMKVEGSSKTSGAGMARPEQLYRADFTGLYPTTDKLQVEIVSYTPNFAGPVQNALESNLVFEAFYTEEFAREAGNKSDPNGQAIDIVSPAAANNTVDDNPVTFRWVLRPECGNDTFPNYQVQLLRLYNRDVSKSGTDETRVHEVVDWSRATTVETGNSAKELTLTLAEGSGYYAWRVRPIGDKYPGGIADDRNWGTWTPAPGNDPGTATVDFEGVADQDLADLNGAVFFYQQFDRDRNWIYSRTFSEGEEGTRIGESMKYATELLQANQAQSHVRSKDVLLVQGMMHDFNGRPAMNTLAAPTPWTGFGYRTDLLHAPGGGAYTAANFDAGTPATGTWKNPDAVDANGLLASYYSDANADLGVPNAAGYPFSRTLFYPDASGRVRENGGVGAVHRIGGGAESVTRTIRSYQGRAAEAELVRLFGDEAPASNTVQRVVTIDPNKTTSIQYVDAEGRTIATCLAAVPVGAGMHLEDLQETQVTDPIAERVTRNTRAGDHEMTSSTTITLVVPTDVAVAYEIDADEARNLCSGTCATCGYVVEFLAIPADDPAGAIRKEAQVVPPSACNPNAPTLHHWSTQVTFSNLGPGSYTIVKRLFVDNANVAGIHQGEEFAAGVEDAMTATLNANPIVTQVRSYLNTADVDAMYTYLDNAGASVTRSGSVYSIDAGCCTLRIDRRVCNFAPRCGEYPDFEGFLYEIWGPTSEFAEAGGTHFGNDLDKYFVKRGGNGAAMPRFDVYNGLHKGQFNTLVDNMINDPIAPYDCSTLWDIWVDLVMEFGRNVSPGGVPDPAHLDPDYDLLDAFLTRAGKQYRGCWNQPYDNLHTVNGAGVGGYLSHAYAFFHYDSDVESTEACRKAMVVPDPNANGALVRVLDDNRNPVSATWARMGTDVRGAAPASKKWEQFERCLTSGLHPTTADLPPGCDPPNSLDCAEALRVRSEGICRTACDRDRAGFERSIRDAYHRDGKTIEEDRYLPNGTPVPQGYTFDVTRAQVECLADLLVQNCMDACRLTLVRDDPNDAEHVTAVGTTAEQSAMREVLESTWEVALPQNGNCTSGWKHVTDANEDIGLANRVVSGMNAWLEAYRAGGGDANTPLTTAQRAWERYRDITGDNSPACTWYTRTVAHGTAEEGCCPPHGLPDIFTLRADISARFEVMAPCSLVFVRECRVGNQIVTNREVLCENMCTVHRCTGKSICFRWVPLDAPDEALTDHALDCRERLARRIRIGLEKQIARCAALERSSAEESYRRACAIPPAIHDVMTIGFQQTRYHFTLYYYDRAGRLVRTVPPAGVTPLAANATRAARPNHTLVTTYEYNSLGQLARQRTPDGNVNRFWYDSFGRVRFAQNFDQLGRNAVNYTKYDALSREIERGEGYYRTESELVANVDNNTYPAANTRDVFQTTYTARSGENYEPFVTARARTQRYLRNRVSAVRAVDGSTATHYSYDPHGNVEWIVQQIQGLGKNYIRYEYDLISGNMRALYYNEGLGDQLTQRWTFDADNRISRVESSRDGAIWDRDAAYDYYLHGPLRRAEYGEDSLQGVDYTYTMQGWLKAINHPGRASADDPGRDADAGAALHPRYGADAFGMALGYFEGDFLRKNSGAGQSPFNSATAGGQYTVRADNISTVGLGLYNGNIAAWSSSILPSPPGTIGTRRYENLTAETYRYDRLNRLLAGTFNSFASSGGGGAGTWSSNGDYNTQYVYDANGNITTLARHGAGGGQNGYRYMDSLAYAYAPGTNRLLHVHDYIGSTLPGTDFENQPPLPGFPPGPPNYAYDGAGRLAGDRNERISAILWTSYDKVREVQKLFGAQRQRFTYDASGNRVKKAIINGNAGTTTYYVREAGGKVIAIYTKECLDAADLGGAAGDGGCVDPAGPPDTDHDGVPNASDNAPGVFNPDQRDTDGDGTADVLEPLGDRDGDGLRDMGPGAPDPCPFDPLNNCTGDRDSDGLPDASDPCPDTPGSGGADRDGDGIPDGCDDDLDGDGAPNWEDNCPWKPNPGTPDANGNGIGDACECGSGAAPSCPVQLAEQFVYGSDADGRVATVHPDRLRDMTDHAPDLLFTRRLAEKEYELNDHLGNVRVRLSDVKVSQGTAGTAPFTIDMWGYANYYPFGMAQPEREMSLAESRYGYNGKEMDHEWNNAMAVAGGTGNSYDYGFRIYDPRLGRFLSEDPLAAGYSGWSPYVYAMDRCIDGVDLDGGEWMPMVRFYRNGWTTKFFTVHIRVLNMTTKGEPEIYVQGVLDAARSYFRKVFHVTDYLNKVEYAADLTYDVYRNAAFSDDALVVEIYSNGVHPDRSIAYSKLAAGKTSFIGNVVSNLVRLQLSRDVDMVEAALAMIHELGHVGGLYHPDDIDSKAEKPLVDLVLKEEKVPALLSYLRPFLNSRNLLFSGDWGYSSIFKKNVDKDYDKVTITVCQMQTIWKTIDKMLPRSEENASKGRPIGPGQIPVVSPAGAYIDKDYDPNQEDPKP